MTLFDYERGPSILFAMFVRRPPPPLPAPSFAPFLLSPPPFAPRAPPRCRRSLNNRAGGGVGVSEQKSDSSPREGRRIKPLTGDDVQALVEKEGGGALKYM